jgi:hypothetical protein
MNVFACAHEGMSQPKIARRDVSVNAKQYVGGLFWNRLENQLVRPKTGDHYRDSLCEVRKININASVMRTVD